MWRQCPAEYDTGVCKSAVEKADFTERYDDEVDVG